MLSSARVSHSVRSRESAGPHQERLQYWQAAWSVTAPQPAPGDECQRPSGRVAKQLHQLRSALPLCPLR